MSTSVSGREGSAALGRRLVWSGSRLSWRTKLALAAAISLFFLAASVVHDLVFYSASHLDLSNKIWLLDVDFEKSVFSWISVVALFSASFILLENAERASTAGRPFVWSWYLLAALFLLLSFDEFAGVHERISLFLGNYIHRGGLFYFTWAAPAGLVAVGGLVAFVPFIRSFQPAIAVLMICSAGLYLGGAVGVEMIGGSVAEASGFDTLRYRMLTNIEEGMELSGVLVFIYAMLLWRGPRYE